MGGSFEFFSGRVTVKQRKEKTWKGVCNEARGVEGEHAC